MSLSWFSYMSSILVELEFGDVEFLVGGKPENPEKNSRRKARINNKINPVTWEASTLTTPQAFMFGNDYSYHNNV